MKKLLTAVALIGLLTGAVRAQDLTGNWQGTLQGGPQALRIVFKIANDGGRLNAVMYSIDQPGLGIGANSVTLQSSNIRITVDAIRGVFEGKLSADGALITGTFTQGGPPRPLNLARASGDSAWAIPTPPTPLKPMAADANPVFEVATIKPSNPDAQGMGYRVNGRQFSTLNTTLTNLITFAYGVQAKQVIGLPAWAEAAKYDIVARPDGEGQPNDKQWKTMVQKLLTERFKLAFHSDKRELSVYALQVAKDGPKMASSQGDPNGLPGLGFRGPGALIARNATMRDFAGTMQNTALDRPVVDQTGLTGRFDFTLTWTPDEFQFPGLPRVPPPPDAAAAPNLYAAIQEQLGLKLDSTKAPADVIVIDRAEKPSDN